MIGPTVHQYEIIEELGRGGMGVVYKAHDTKLDRIVALKFLPHGLISNDAERARFLQEARAAAALNHPHACAVYDIQEANEEQFIVMEYVDGMTLRKKIGEAHRAGKPGLSASDAVNYAVQIGDALQEAHAKNIIHRDVKSENIMVNGKNQIKVMDFGLAKLKGTLKLTRTSSTVGTLAYMAPEQITGGDADARSDIFSFGIVIFEMLAGKTPFRGEHDAAMMYSIINEQPESVLKYVPDLSPEYERIIGRMLEKDPEDRYQSVADVVSELRREQKKSGRIVRPADTPGSAPAVRRESAVDASYGRPGTTGGAGKKAWFITAGVLLLAATAVLLLLRGSPTSKPETASGRKMLVVMPFQNLGSPDQEYFADGITEEITSKLSGLSGLGVIAQSSAMQYKKTAKTIRQIGEELGVNYVLQGTIRWQSENGTSRVRVTPQLISVADGTQLWSQPSEAVVSSAFQIQSDIASQVAQALDITLVQKEQQSLASKLTDNAEAYDAYLRGSEYQERGFSERDYRFAEQMFQKAVDLDPNFVMAHARLAALHSHIYWEQYDHTEERVRKCRTEAETALRLDPNAPGAHGAMGWYYYHCLRDYDRAQKEFSTALSAQPNNTDLLQGIASISRRLGKWDDAARYFTKITEIDPRSGNGWNDLGSTNTYTRNYATAMRCYERSMALAPEIVDNYESIALIDLLWKGNAAEAMKTLDDARGRKIGLDDPSFYFFYYYAALCSGNYPGSIQFLESSGIDVLNYQFWRYPTSLLLGDLCRFTQLPEKARAQYDTARKILEDELRKRPEDSRIHSALGLAYAGLGRRDDAIREGKRGVELMPVTVDAGIGPERVRELAQIYTTLGEEDAAINELRMLLSTSTLVSAQLLKVDPTWNPLRKNRRFQQLLEEHQ